MKWILALVLVSAITQAEDFAARAERGDRLSMTAVGDAYHDAIAPAVHAAAQSCFGAAGLAAGMAVTIVAQVGTSGALSSVEAETATPVANCLVQQLQQAALPAPAGWTTQSGTFALTLRLGIGRGSVDGVRHGD